MPIGCTSLIPFVYDELMRSRPSSVLDLGVGMGLHGAGVRQWLDLGVQPWRTHLAGVEGFGEYRNPCWDLYDEIRIEPIEQYVGRRERRFDAVLLLDVLEHFERDAGLELLDGCRSLLEPGGVLLVGTPAVWHPQEACHGNELERHRSLWAADDLQAAGLDVRWDGQPDRWGNQMLLATARQTDASPPSPSTTHR